MIIFLIFLIILIVIHMPIMAVLYFGVPLLVFIVGWFVEGIRTINSDYYTNRCVETPKWWEFWKYFKAW